MPEDWEWRPTWISEWRLPRPFPGAAADQLKVYPALLTACKATDDGDKEAAALLARLATGLASLEHPRLAVQAALDGQRMKAFSKALHSAIAIKGPGKKNHAFKDRLFEAAEKGRQSRRLDKSSHRHSA
eukprot:1139018-Pelagomonas_calceolata.AAC.9